MTIYKLDIDAISGIETYSIINPDLLEISKFLALYDHEGSVITLTRFTEIPKPMRNEEAYKFIEEQTK